MQERLAILAVAKDLITAEYEAERDRVAHEMDAGGVKSTEPTVAGERVAVLSLVRPKPSVYVSDPRAWLEYVRAIDPQCIELYTPPPPAPIERVRPDVERDCLATFPHTDGVVYDPATGEPVPGLAVKEKAPYTSLKFAPNGRAHIAEAWRSGALTATVLPALEGK